MSGKIFHSNFSFGLFVLMIFFISFSYAQTDKNFELVDANGNKLPVQLNSSLTEKPIPSTPLTVIVCACPPIAGVTCSITGTTNSGTSTAAAAGCPHVGYCDPGANNPWTSAAGTGTIQYMFSAPVSGATLRANSVNSNDFATVSASGGAGGALSISGVVCMGVAGLVLGPLSVAGSYGGVSWTVNSTGSYTNVTLLNTGAQSGWVATCPTAITVSVLPIELVSFTGVCNSKNKVDLSWRTASEFHNDYFTLERSKNENDWEIITRVAGAGNSNTVHNYSYIDQQPLQSISYYRLKQSDSDGSYKYSNLIAVDNCNGSDISTIGCFPNPANVEFTVQSSITETIIVSNELGLEIQNIELNAANNYKAVISNLQNGVYFIAGKNSKQKVVVIR